MSMTAEERYSPILDRYPCQRCGRRDGLDAVVRDSIWEKLSAAAGGANILCLWCMDALAFSLGILAGATLHFAGLALHSENDVNRAVEIVMAAKAHARAALEAAWKAGASVETANKAAQRVQDEMLAAIRVLREEE